nr:twin-arginine translocase TatA/TatE family subunit [Desulfobacterales bacterium]
MFGISMPEMFLILAIAIIVIGPKKLPDLARTVGKAVAELKKAASDFKESIAIDDQIKDVKNAADDVSNSIKDVIDIGNGDKIDHHADDKNPEKIHEKQ